MKKILIVIVILAVVGIGIYFFALKDGGKFGNNSGDSENIFKNDLYNFSFEIPDKFLAKEISQEDGSLIVTVEKADEPKKSSQFLVSYFDETDLVITEERIKQDVPDMPITDAREIEIGDGENIAKGISFNADNPDFGGKSFEIWFVKGNNLYQYSGYVEAKEVMSGIIEGFRFGEN